MARPDKSISGPGFRVSPAIRAEVVCERNLVRAFALFVTSKISFADPGSADMPRGDKSSYTAKQKRRAEHIEEGYERRGVSRKEAARRAWATVNKESGGGKKSGSGRGKAENRSASRKGGRLGGRAAARRPAAARKASARKSARTRKRRAAR
jgi:plasmid stabilization system protein ParE